MNTSEISSNSENTPSSAQSKLRSIQNDYETIDPESANKIRILEQIKDKAVNSENFD